MRILVTGGAGFLGSHLSTRLIAENYEVICFDNLYTGNFKNISHLLSNPRFQFIEGDVTTPYDFKVEGIFNLACPASPVHYQSDPIGTVKTNVLGAINALECADRNNARVFQSSTSEIYGDPLQSPQNESYWGNVNPIGIRSCYDEGKRVAETLFFDYFRQKKLDIRVARIFNTFGPQMAKNDGRVVSNFILQALEDKPISIYGDGSQTRSFCYVSDLIEGFMKLFFAENVYEPINLGNPEPISVLNLAFEIIELCNSKSEIVFMELPSDDPKQREPDIARAINILDWSPNTSRKEGLEKTISYFSGRK
jgi:UDP-glucuronate decarboxylase